MNIQGLQKLTLLDYPGKVACTIFTGGCNFRCPFCHNASLVVDVNNKTNYSEEEILSFLRKRQGILDGVCITGGEPLLQRDIVSFIEKIKALGYAVKLDTNGSFPDRLKAIVDKGIIDYVAMDIKNSKESYAKTIGAKKYDLTPIMQSVDFLLSDKIDYEFRTTLVKQFHTMEDIVSIGKWIKGAKRYYLQSFADSGNVIESGLSALDKSEIITFKNTLKDYIQCVKLRGI